MPFWYAPYFYSLDHYSQLQKTFPENTSAGFQNSKINWEQDGVICRGDSGWDGYSDIEGKV